MPTRLYADGEGGVRVTGGIRSRADENLFIIQKYVYKNLNNISRRSFRAFPNKEHPPFKTSIMTDFCADVRVVGDARPLVTKAWFQLYAYCKFSVEVLALSFNPVQGFHPSEYLSERGARALTLYPDTGILGYEQVGSLHSGQGSTNQKVMAPRGAPASREFILQQSVLGGKYE